MAPENPAQPLQVLSFIIAPALLTNASTLLVLSASNRFSRAVDRSRELAARSKPAAAGQIERAQHRAHLLSWSLLAYYFACSIFAAGTFVELLGAGFASVGKTTIAPAITGLGIAASMVGMLAIAVGSLLLSFEVMLAYGGLHEEVRESAQAP